VQHNNHLIGFIIAGLYLERDIVVRDIGDLSLVNAPRHRFDIHILTSESNEKIFDMLKVHFGLLVRTAF